LNSALRWLSRLNPEQLLWVDEYLRARITHLGERRGHRDDLIICITYLLDQPEGREIVRKMRNAAAQKRFRERNGANRAYNIPIRNEVKAQLNRLAKKSGSSISATLEDLITGAHSRELLHLREMRKLKDKTDRRLKEMAESERQAKKAAMRIQERLNSALEQLSEKIACLKGLEGLEGEELAAESETIYKQLLRDNEEVYLKLTRSGGS